MGRWIGDTAGRVWFEARVTRSGARSGHMEVRYLDSSREEAFAAADYYERSSVRAA